MKKILHINQHVIRKNTKTGERNPVITCKTYKSNNYCHTAIIKDKNGDEVEHIYEKTFKKNYTKTKMSEKEITQTIMFINTLGYYQCYDAVKEWFKWDDKTTKENIKSAFSLIMKKR